MSAKSLANKRRTADNFGVAAPPERITPKSDFHGGFPDSHANTRSMSLDRVDVHILYRETVMRLDVLRRRVRENNDVLAASEFCRWLRFSGVFKVFEVYPSGAPLEVSASTVRKLVEDLLQECGERMRGGKPVLPGIELSELEMLNAKIDALTEHVARLSPSSAVTPVLHVIDGKGGNEC